MTSTGSTHPADSQWYEIRIQGQLDKRWASHFEAMTLTTSNGSTVLRGRVVDQAALHGLLRQLRDLGLPLVCLTQIPTDESDHSQAGDLT